MSNDRRSFDVPLLPGSVQPDDRGKPRVTHLRVQVFHDDGKSMFSRAFSRGTHLSISPIVIDGIWVTQKAGSAHGMRAFLEPRARLNQPALDKWLFGMRVQIAKYLETRATAHDFDPAPGLGVTLLLKVLAQQGLQVQDLAGVPFENLPASK